MKWSIVGLVLLGILAAAAAAFLVASMQAGKRPADDTREAAQSDAAPVVPDVDVLVAARDLQPGISLGLEDLEVQRVPVTARPEGAHSTSPEVIGRVPVVPLKKGQAITSSLLASQGSPQQFAAALRPGERAVSVMLTDRMGLEGLLYPGCAVDVLASVTLKGKDGGEEQKFAMTILEAVTVLGVGERTIVEPEAADKGRAGANMRQAVKLRVDPRQAEKLLLAMEGGSVSLVIRNPTDTGSRAAEATRLPALNSTFARLEELLQENHRLEAERAEEQRQKQEILAAWDHERAERLIERDRASADLDADRHFVERTKLAREKAELITPRRPVMILRGGVAESTLFDVPALQTETASTSSSR